MATPGKHGWDTAYSPQQLRQAPNYLNGIELDGYC